MGAAGTGIKINSLRSNPLLQSAFGVQSTTHCVRAFASTWQMAGPGGIDPPPLVLETSVLPFDTKGLWRRVWELHPRTVSPRSAAFKAGPHADCGYPPCRRKVRESNPRAVSPRHAAFGAVLRANRRYLPYGGEPGTRTPNAFRHTRIPTVLLTSSDNSPYGGGGRICTYARISPCTP